MKGKKLYLAFSILLIFGLNIALSVSATVEYNYADEDSYVNSNNPTQNYGSDSYFYVGEYNGDNEFYVHFDLSQVPVAYSTAKVFLYIWYSSNSPQLNVYLVTETWDEDTITWNNKPSKGTLITSLTPTFYSNFEVDITSYIDDEDEISLCITSPTSSAYCEGYTGDWSTITSYAPRIEFDTTFFTSMIMLVVIIVIILIISAGTYVYLKKQKGKPKKPKRSAYRPYIAAGPALAPPAAMPPPRPVQPVLPVIPAKSSPEASAVFCHYCGNKVKTAKATFCESCGSKLTD